MTSFAVVSTSYIHFWYGFLERSVEKVVSMAYNRVLHTVIKVFIDQTTNSVFYNAVFFYLTARLEGKPSEEAIQRVDERLWPQMQVGVVPLTLGLLTLVHRFTGPSGFLTIL
jgi:hypothetical protein